MKRVRAYPFDRLPRVARNQVQAARSFRAHLPLGIGPAFADAGRAMGGAVALELVECFVARARDLEALLSGVVVRLAAPGERWALVVIDRALAVALAGRALGIDAERAPELPAPRRPTLAEVGAIELLVALLVEAQPVQVVGVVEGEELLGLIGALGDEALVHVLEARVSSPVGRGAARLLAPESLALAAPPLRDRASLLARRARLAALRTHVAFELGRATLPRQALVELRLGDVVAFPIAAPRLAGPIPITLRVGRGGFAAQLVDDAVSVTEPFRKSQGAAMPAESPPRVTDDAADQLLGELPVEVVCELGRTSMSGRELLELEPGAVLPLHKPLAGPIELTVGGRVVARGELVDVEGDLGVRVTEIVE